MEQEQAFRGEALYSGALEGALVEKDYSIRVDNIRWLRPGEATILSDQFFLEWLMYREEDVECAGPGRRFVASHAVILVPPGPRPVLRRGQFWGRAPTGQIGRAHV